MKRIKSACLEQTLLFTPKDGLGEAAGARAVLEEIEHYQKQLDRTHVRYKILEQQAEPDGSVLIRIKRQYNNHDCTEYMS